MDCIQNVQTGASDFDGPDFYRCEKRTSVKEHICTECGRTIFKGERYLIEVGAWDGNISTFKTCDDCRSIRCSFFCAGFLYGFMISDLEEHIRDYRGEIGEIHISCLTPAARDRVCDLIEKEWRRDEV
jgi:hypothetical protein